MFRSASACRHVKCVCGLKVSALCALSSAASVPESGAIRQRNESFIKSNFPKRLVDFFWRVTESDDRDAIERRAVVTVRRFRNFHHRVMWVRVGRRDQRPANCESTKYSRVHRVLHTARPTAWRRGTSNYNPRCRRRTGRHRAPACARVRGLYASLTTVQTTGESAHVVCDILYIQSAFCLRNQSLETQ